MKPLIYKEELIFVRLLLPLLGGIIGGANLPGMASYSVLVYLSVIVLLLFIGCVIFYKPWKLYFSRWKAGLLVQIFVFLVGLISAFQRPKPDHPKYFTSFKSEALAILIQSEPKTTGDFTRFEAEVKQSLNGTDFSLLNGKLLVTLKSTGGHKYCYGEELLIPAIVQEVEPPYNPYQFNYKKYLANRGIYHQTFVHQDQIQVINAHRGNPVVQYALSLREGLVLKFNRYISNKEAASVASTLILGYKAELSPEVLSAYSKTGTMHVLSVSGMHVGIVFIILNALLWFLNRNRRLRIVRALLIICLIWFYALLTGFSPSVCRAAVMLSFYVFGKAINRSSNSYNLVAISAVFLLLYNPYFLFDVGFQLSYLAVLGLIYFYPIIYHTIYVKSWIGDKIWSYAALSCAAQLATFPIGMYYFHQFPVYFLLSNLLIVIPVILIMYLGILFLFVPWEALLKLIGTVLEKSIVLMNDVLFYLEKLPLASLANYRDSILYYIAIYFIILTLIWALCYRSKAMLYAALATIFLFVGYESVDSIIDQNRKSIVFYSLKKHVAFGFFSAGTGWIYSDLDNEDKSLTFSAASAIESNASQVFYHKLADKRNDGLMHSDGNFFIFDKWRILRWGKENNYKSFSKPINVDVLLLSGGPKVEVRDLMKYVKFDLLLIDGTNPNYKITNWVTEASKLSLNYRVLKSNPAYTINH